MIIALARAYNHTVTLQRHSVSTGLEIVREDNNFSQTHTHTHTHTHRHSYGGPFYYKSFSAKSISKNNNVYIIMLIVIIISQCLTLYIHTPL